jgi:hypothetical protein
VAKNFLRHGPVACQTSFNPHRGKAQRQRRFRDALTHDAKRSGTVSSPGDEKQTSDDSYAARALDNRHTLAGCAFSARIV